MMSAGCIIAAIKKQPPKLPMSDSLIVDVVPILQHAAINVPVCAQSALRHFRLRGVEVAMTEHTGEGNVWALNAPAPTEY